MVPLLDTKLRSLIPNRTGIRILLYPTVMLYHAVPCFHPELWDWPDWHLNLSFMIGPLSSWHARSCCDTVCREQSALCTCQWADLFSLGIEGDYVRRSLVSLVVRGNCCSLWRGSYCRVHIRQWESLTPRFIACTLQDVLPMLVTR